MKAYQILICAFPRRWRAAHGEALAATLAECSEERSMWMLGFDLLRAGLAERLHEFRWLVGHRTASTRVVALTSATTLAATPRRRAGRWAAIALPFVVLAAGVPFALRVERGPSMPQASPPVAAISSTMPLTTPRVVDGKHVGIVDLTRLRATARGVVILRVRARAAQAETQAAKVASTDSDQRAASVAYGTAVVKIAAANT